MACDGAAKWKDILINEPFILLLFANWTENDSLVERATLAFDRQKVTAESKQQI
jgi:hypothetical protein